MRRVVNSHERYILALKVEFYRNFTQENACYCSLYFSHKKIALSLDNALGVKHMDPRSQGAAIDASTDRQITTTECAPGAPSLLWDAVFYVLYKPCVYRTVCPRNGHMSKGHNVKIIKLCCWQARVFRHRPVSLAIVCGTLLADRLFVLRGLHNANPA